MAWDDDEMKVGVIAAVMVWGIGFAMGVILTLLVQVAAG